MYTSVQRRWQAWAYALRRRGMAPWVGAVLEAGAPLWPLSAQFLHAFQGFLPQDDYEALVALLDDEGARQRFMTWLTEGDA